MIITAVIGKSNSGKASTIKYAMKNLLEFEGSAVLYFSRYPKRYRDGCEDKKDLVRYLNKRIIKGLSAERDIGLLLIRCNDMIVGLTTYGDCFKDIKNNYLKAMELSSEKMSIFVCARHANNNVKKEFITDELADGLDAVECIESKGLSKLNVKEEWNQNNRKNVRKIFEKELEFMNIERGEKYV